MWIVCDHGLRMVEAIDIEHYASEQGGYVVATTKTGDEVTVGNYAQPKDGDPLVGIRKAHAAFAQLAAAIKAGERLFFMPQGEDLYVAS